VAARLAEATRGGDVVDITVALKMVLSWKEFAWRDPFGVASIPTWEETNDRSSSDNDNQRGNSQAEPSQRVCVCHFSCNDVNDGRSSDASGHTVPTGAMP
jgi:hypothetical protein